MKKLYIFFALLILSVFMVGCSGKTDKDGITNDNQSGGAGITDNENDTLDNQEPDDGLVSVWLLEKKYNVSDDGDEIASAYKYDEKGNVLEETIYKKGKENMRNVYRYNEQGDVVSQSYFEEGVEANKFTFEHTYDENGKLSETIKVRNYIKDNKVFKSEESRYTYVYDNNNNIVCLKHDYKSSDTGEYDDCFETNYVYNEKGDIVLQEEVRNGEFFKKVSYEYDKNGNKTLESKIYDGTHTEYRCEYDDNNNMIKEICMMDDKELFNYTYEYNNDGYVKHTGGNYAKEYTYDKNGNIIYENDLYDSFDDVKYTYTDVRITPEQQKRLNQKKEYL